jgi:hypothetical protein
MTSQIQQQPVGLLPALGIQASGTNPRFLMDEVRPTLDLMPFYGARALQGFFQSDAAIGPGPNFTIDLPVPAGQVWRLLAANAVLIVGAAAESAKISVGVFAANNAMVRIGNSGPQVAVNAAATLVCAAVLPEPLILMPGTRIQARYDDISVAAARFGQVSALVQVFSA